MKFILFQAGMFLLAANLAMAQGTLTGVVTDQSNTPLQNVNIYIPTLKKGYVRPIWKFYHPESSARNI